VRGLGDGVGQAPGLLHDVLEQFVAVDPVALPGRRTAFQPREREQVAHQHLHALRLLAHQAQVALALVLFQRNALHGFHEAAEHGQRGADLVRDVGHEIAAHGFGQLHRCDVARKQQLALLAVRVDLQQDLGGLGRLGTRAINLDLAIEKSPALR
jgi:hypothetical protein